jgi:hypothetical protein
MTDEQFKQLLEIQFAQLAVLQAMEYNLRVLAIKADNRAGSGVKWDSARDIVKNAASNLPK